MRSIGRGWWVGGVVALLPWVATAGDWEQLSNGPVSIRTRARAGTPVHEVWAEGDMDAPVQDVQAAILDAESYPKFMPYVRETRFLTKEQPDHSRTVYSRVEPPLVSSRDYALRVVVQQMTNPDGSGEFMNQWSAVPDAVPLRPNTVRLRTNEGFWHVFPKDGKTRVVYRFAVDPGVGLPQFALNWGNRSGVTDTFKAVEREARRRTQARAQTTSRR